MEPDSECESCGWVFENGGDPPQVFTVNYGPRAGESITRCSMCLNTQNALGCGARDVERTVLYCANAILARLLDRLDEIAGDSRVTPKSQAAKPTE